MVHTSTCLVELWICSVGMTCPARALHNRSYLVLIGPFIHLYLLNFLVGMLWPVILMSYPRSPIFTVLYLQCDVIVEIPSRRIAIHLVRFTIYYVFRVCYVVVSGLYYLWTLLYMDFVVCGLCCLWSQLCMDFVVYNF
jgi:hypothetical protein